MLQIKENSIQDDIIIPLNRLNQITVYDDHNVLEGNLQILNNYSTSQPVIVIKGSSYNIVQNGFKIDSLSYRFSYSSSRNFDLNNQILKVDFGDAWIADKQKIQTQMAIGEYKSGKN